MTSLWHMTGPRIVAFGPHGTEGWREGERFDTVVVGAGLTGITMALLLVRAGQRVLVLEARTAGAVTTGNTTGKVSLLQGNVLSEIRRHSGDEVVKAYVEANREGSAWLLRQLESRGVATERRTAYTFATTQNGTGLLERELEASLIAGVPAEWTSDAGVPFPITGALRLDSQAQIHPMIVLAELAAELHERGGRLVERCRVHDVDTSPHGVDIMTSLGRVEADACVHATGTPILDRGMFFARLEPSRSFVCAYPMSTEAIPNGMHISIDSPHRSLRSAEDPSGRPLLLVGGGSHVTGRDDDTRHLLSEIDDWTHEWFTAGARSIWWGAQDYRRHSRLPFAAALAGAHGRVYAATGYNKWGMTNAIAAALTLAADILGEAPGWARTLREHQIGFADAGETLRAGVAVAGRLAGDWADTEIVGPAVDRVKVEEGEGEIARDGVSPVAVARVGGRVCRVSGVCTHMGGILHWNAAERSWDCPLHGSRFSPDGSLLEGPAVSDLEQR